MSPDHDGVVLATITIQKIVDNDDITIWCGYDDDLPLVDGLGMLELAKDTLIRDRMGEDD